MADLVSLNYSDDGESLVPVLNDTWDILNADFTDDDTGWPRLTIKGTWLPSLPAAHYLVQPNGEIWELNGKVYRLDTRKDVMEFYSAAQALLLDRALEDNDENRS